MGPGKFHIVVLVHDKKECFLLKVIPTHIPNVQTGIKNSQSDYTITCLVFFLPNYDVNWLLLNVIPIESLG